MLWSLSFLKFSFSLAECHISTWQDEATERKNIASFSLVWNKFIHSMRMEDLISNRLANSLLNCLSIEFVKCMYRELWYSFWDNYCTGIEIYYSYHHHQVTYLLSSGPLSCSLARYMDVAVFYINCELNARSSVLHSILL